MRKTALVLSGVIFSLALLTGLAQAADKFGYIDLSRTFSEYNKTKDYDKQKQADLRKEQEEKTKEILGEIQAAVKKYSEKEGYTFVFNDRVLVYQTKSLDITTQIVEILNKGGK